MMRILAMDTATGACSVALWQDGKVTARRFQAMARGQAEILAPMAMEVLDEANIDFDSLDALAVTIGPGAFTGIRIGLAAARGMALAAGLPLVGVSTLEAVAHNVAPAERAGRHLLVALDTKRGDIYVQLFDPDLVPVGLPLAVPPEAVAGMIGEGPVLVVGDAVATVLPALHDAGVAAEASAGSGLPDAGVVAAVAAGRPLPEAGPMPEPLYLRAPDAKVAENGGRLRP